MATFSHIPAFGAQKAIKPRVLTARFGDGYEQRVADGINAQPQAWSLTFNRSTADIAAIDTFLATAAGVASFDWTPPGGSAGKYVCREWQRVLNDGAESLTATFEQVFEP